MYGNSRYAFDPSAIPPEDRAGRSGALPVGDYLVAVTEAEVKTTRRGGEGINFTLEIQLPAAHTGRRCWYWVNTSVPHSPEAERIGRGQLYRLTEAVGGGEAFAWQDASQLFGRPFVVRLGVEDDPAYGQRNRVLETRPQRRAAPPVQAQPTVRQQQPVQAQPAPPPPITNYGAKPLGIQPGGYEAPPPPQDGWQPPGDDDIPF